MIAGSIPMPMMPKCLNRQRLRQLGQILISTAEYVGTGQRQSVARMQQQHKFGMHAVCARTSPRRISIQSSPALPVR